MGFVVARVLGLGDIRRHGSGNIGAANVLRTLGKGPAAVTLLGDIVKGAAAVALARGIAAGDEPTTAAAAAIAVAGNCWPVFLRFRGGKGVATGFGAMLSLVPWATLPAAVAWLVIALTFRYASLASVIAAATVPLGALVLYSHVPARWVAALAVAVVIVWRHRENIARLLAGTERRIGDRTAA
ncbi:MAG: glycerol-3-phosphate 1-O-acyltransferase PlsY [Candidatus Rokubacteria bacterium]|nr:glycerol-3-phosphate 1-O-acyltransferase PlsY [Candidatus Rokubacteria bacterium]